MAILRGASAKFGPFWTENGHFVRGVRQFWPFLDRKWPFCAGRLPTLPASSAKMGILREAFAKTATLRKASGNVGRLSWGTVTLREPSANFSMLVKPVSPAAAPWTELRTRRASSIPRWAGVGRVAHSAHAPSPIRLPRQAPLAARFSAIRPTRGEAVSYVLFRTKRLCVRPRKGQLYVLPRTTFRQAKDRAPFRPIQDDISLPPVQARSG